MPTPALRTMLKVQRQGYRQGYVRAT